MTDPRTMTDAELAEKVQALHLLRIPYDHEGYIESFGVRDEAARRLREQDNHAPGTVPNASST